jgi:hypothetical protein
MMSRSLKIGLALVTALLVSLASVATTASAKEQKAAADTPVFAYYYIWFNPTSWNRAKTDYPVLGRYSSDERDVMRKHIRWAKQSGINGFIVSWKSTESLNRRLAKLIQVAHQEDFHLTIIYQGLDFERNPLPVTQVASDFDFYIREFSQRRAFKFFRKPVVIWSGTWKFTRDEIAFVTRSRQDKLLILATERDLEGYERVGDLVDGNAYYWSSVNPDTFPNYEERLRLMGDAVHARGDLWFAPAAPGFDALLIGGSTVVERKGGDTLRREYNAAIGSSPDVIGLISWNEFSENSHIEPSERHGARYLQVLADIRGAKAPEIESFDSSEPASTAKSYGPVVIGAFVLILIVLVFYVLRRRVEPPRKAQDSRAE